MKLTGLSSIYLPQVRNFYFSITGIKAPSSGVLDFIFYDTGSNSFTFRFSGGYISENKTLSTYNSLSPSDICGTLSGSKLTYKVNDVCNQKTCLFTGLNGLTVSGSQYPIYFDLIVSSAPINYSFNVYSTYNYGDYLTGVVSSDTNFIIRNPSLFFYNSNQELLSYTGSGILNIGSGYNYIKFKDIDDSATEYYNNFETTLNTTFGNIGKDCISRRANLLNKNILNFSDFYLNTYYQQPLFDVYSTGNRFVYVDEPSIYNLGYNIGNIDYNANPLPSILSVKYEPLYQLSNSGYYTEYITGYAITNSGMYSGQPPQVNFKEYFYVTGISNSFSSLLFSSGCSSTMSISFTGVSGSGNASGYLSLSDVYISGIYGAGTNKFKIVSSYTPMNSGSGYQSAPLIVWGTGGSCYSLPNYSGVQSGQFKRASGYGAIVGHSAGVTGSVLTSGITGVLGTVTGYKVTGLQISNIGYGYNTTYPPTISFSRWTGDLLTNNASGVFYYKYTGFYNFTGFWNVNYNFDSKNSYSLTAYSNYYSGNISIPPGNNNINLNIYSSGLDNTRPISGKLSFYLVGGNQSATGTRILYQSRTFDANTGALVPNTYPINEYSPPPDLSPIFEQDQNDFDYQTDFGDYTSITY